MTDFVVNSFQSVSSDELGKLAGSKHSWLQPADSPPELILDVRIKIIL